MEFKHVAYGLSFVIDTRSLPKTYGIVRPKGRRPYIRNYKREIKNGLSCFDVLKWHQERLSKELTALYKKE